MAKNYLEAAKLLVANGKIGAPVGLLCWQSFENSLKALSAPHNIPETHDLGKIIRHLRANGVLEKGEITDLKLNAYIVTGSHTYNDTRYPEKKNGLVYWQYMSQTTIKDVCRAAEETYLFVGQKVMSGKEKRVKT
jgi:HEPN domain-containing protein